MNDSATTAAALPDPDFSHLKVLVAEDNPVSQIVIVELLAATGIQITLVENGQQLLEQYGFEDWDLVLTDRHMPVMDGLEAAKRIREQESMCQAGPMPIACITAEDSVPDTLLPSPFSKIILKPLTRRGLMSGIQDMLESSLREHKQYVEAGSAGSASLDRKTIEELLADFGRDASEFFEIYLRDARLHLEKISEHLRDDDMKELFASAHALKGASMNAGAPGIAGMCKQIEQSATAGAVASLEKLVDQLHSGFAEVARKIALIIKTQ